MLLQLTGNGNDERRPMFLHRKIAPASLELRVGLTNVRTGDNELQLKNRSVEFRQIHGHLYRLARPRLGRGMVDTQLGRACRENARHKERQRDSQPNQFKQVPSAFLHRLPMLQVARLKQSPTYLQPRPPTVFTATPLPLPFPTLVPLPLISSYSP